MFLCCDNMVAANQINGNSIALFDKQLKVVQLHFIVVLSQTFKIQLALF